MPLQLVIFKTICNLCMRVSAMLHFSGTVYSYVLLYVYVILLHLLYKYVCVYITLLHQLPGIFVYGPLVFRQVTKSAFI